MAAKAETFNPGSFTGKELGGAEDSFDGLYDHETNPHKDMPLEEFERLIDGDGAATEAASDKDEPAAEESKTETEAPKGDTAEDKTAAPETGDDTETAVEAPAEETETEKPSLEDRFAALEEKDAKRDLELERLKLHNSRLAAKLGNAEKKLQDRRRDTTTGDVDTDGLDELRDEIATLKAEQHADALDRAVQQEFARFGARPEFVELKPILQKLSSQFEDRYKELASIQDVTEARLAARELQLDMLTEARAEKSKTDRAEAERRKLDASAKLKQDKKKASVTESSVRGAAAKPKGFDPETAPLEELEAVVDREAGIRR